MAGRRGDGRGDDRDDPAARAPLRGERDRRAGRDLPGAGRHRRVRQRHRDRARPDRGERSLSARLDRVVVTGADTDSSGTTRARSARRAPSSRGPPWRGPPTRWPPSCAARRPRGSGSDPEDCAARSGGGHGVGGPWSGLAELAGARRRGQRTTAAPGRWPSTCTRVRVAVDTDDRRGAHPAVGARRRRRRRRQPAAVPRPGRGRRGAGRSGPRCTRRSGSTTPARVTTRVLRDYHLPQCADVPLTEVLFADTVDELGPFGAKSMSESPYNPVAPAIANAIRDAVGVRPYRLPMTRDRLWALFRTLTRWPSGPGALRPQPWASTRRPRSEAELLADPRLRSTRAVGTAASSPRSPSSRAAADRRSGRCRCPGCRRRCGPGRRTRGRASAPARRSRRGRRGGDPS